LKRLSARKAELPRGRQTRHVGIANTYHTLLPGVKRYPIDGKGEAALFSIKNRFA
jgi:hypothetical protein